MKKLQFRLPQRKKWLRPRLSARIAKLRKSLLKMQNSLQHHSL